MASYRITLLCGWDDCSDVREPGVPLCVSHWAEVDPDLRARYREAAVLLRDVRLEIMSARIRRTA
jgi:hypothetical protein